MTVTPTIEVTVNGEAREVPQGMTVGGLLDHLGVRRDRVAVELNRSIVHQRDWGKTGIETAAQVEIVEFVGGG